MSTEFLADPTSPNNNVQTWIGTGTTQWYEFTIPPYFKMAYILAVGGGGGGGAGQDGNYTNGAGGGTGFGGGGGGSGAIVEMLIPITFLPSTLYIQPGAGGAGAPTGTGKTGTTGATGSAGGISYVSCMPRSTNTGEIIIQSNAAGAGGGGGGSSSAGAGGLAGTIGTIGAQYIAQCAYWKAYAGIVGQIASGGVNITPSSFIGPGAGGGATLTQPFGTAASGIVPGNSGAVNGSGSTPPTASSAGYDFITKTSPTLGLVSIGGSGGGCGPTAGGTTVLINTGTVGGNGGPGSGGGGGGAGGDNCSISDGGGGGGNGGPGFVKIILF